MGVFERILLATDGSAEAYRASAMAGDLASGLGSELHVAYVEPVPEEYVNWWAGVASESVEDMFARAGEVAREKTWLEATKLKEAGVDVARVHGRVGSPEAEIVRLAEEIGADLVVVGSRGAGPLKRALVGSVSTEVVRHAHGSVLVVRGGGRLPGRILLAHDGSEEARAASRAAAGISAKTGSELHVLTTLPVVTPYPYPPAKDAWEEARRQAQSFVEEQARHLGAETNGAVETRIALGDPEKEIVREGERLGAALIVVGSRGLGAVRRTLLGSVSDSVVRHAHCPVLVFRRTGP